MPAEPERIIVITGGASGIGRTVARLCAQKGNRIALLDTNTEEAQRAADEAIALGASKTLAIRCDVRNEADVESAFGKIVEQLGVPDGTFANAGIDTSGLIHDLPLETWNRVLQTNLTGVFLTCKYAIRAMLEAQKKGSIVCTSSPTGFVALAAGSAGCYSATKAGISALVRCMAIDYARFGIRVNAIVPGATETALMWNNVAPEEIPRMRATLQQEIPLGRLADPEDPARAVVWLLSEDASYITGSHLVCDGGILAKASISV